MSKRAQEGRVEYTDRAFSQDAQQAMKGDIVRGLIELITNSDDAYVDAVLTRGHPGKIAVEVEHRKNQSWTVIVRDRATGIRDLVGTITKLGKRSSGFELGKQKRGNLGRGAKDLAAFGLVIFRTIYSDMYQELHLRPNGEWRLEAERKVTELDRKLTGVSRGSGTMVEVRVDSQFRCPRHDTLRRDLSTHFALRGIMSDACRRVTLMKLNNGEDDLLCYEPPISQVVVDECVPLPGYAPHEMKLRIWRLPERCDEGAWDHSRPSGILIKGNRAIYENTLFDYEGNTHAGWFGGELECPVVDELARDFDDRQQQGWAPDPMNPLNPILRGRDGLEKNHPLYASIRAAVKPFLARLVEEEAERARQDESRSVSDDTRRALDSVARELGRMINEEMRDIEAEELAGGPEEGEVPAIQLVPEEAYAYLGEDRTLTIAVRKDRASVGDLVEVSASPEGVVGLLNAAPALIEHKRREDLLVAQARLRPSLAGEMTIVSARIGELCAEAIVTVRPERSQDPDEDTVPDTLEFESERYRVGWKKLRTVKLRAPAEIVDSFGARVHISSSDEGVIVRTPQVVLEYHESSRYFEARIEVEARKLGSTTLLTAELGDLVAEASVVVSRSEDSPGLRLRFDDEAPGYWRGIIEKGEGKETGITTIKVMTNHPSIKPYLGRNLEYQDTPVCRQLVAEVVADTAARMVVQDLFRMRGTSEEFDASRFYREHYIRFTKFLPRLQKILVGPPEIAATRDRLDSVELFADAS